MSPRVKNFIWRICRNCIPTRMRLRDKWVNCDIVCSLCNSEEEDTLHLFFHCPSSCSVWSMWEGYSSIYAILSQDYDSKTIVFKILQVLAAEDAAAFCCILWSIWKQRNDKVWNKVTDANTFVLSRAKDSLHEWKLASNLQQTDFVPRQ
ncbi:uncharacterized protein [Medicago truncatula]|uniref:uncharacterized protein n=1 Tax=Medicago truncatula TaxID=3880 RepID=UPI000D2F412A|nr:uncharacterized protein LOC112420826 [Medicago truncatula]